MRKLSSSSAAETSAKQTPIPEDISALYYTGISLADIAPWWKESNVIFDLLLTLYKAFFYLITP